MDAAREINKIRLLPPTIPGDELVMASLKIRNLAHALTTIQISVPAVAKVLHNLADELEGRPSRP
jgi:hypothetical protein